MVRLRCAAVCSGRDVSLLSSVFLEDRSRSFVRDVGAYIPSQKTAIFMCQFPI